MEAGATPTKADYGLDAPGVIRNLSVFGTVLLVAGIVVGILGGRWAGLAPIGYWPGGSLIVTAALMVTSSRVGKISAARRLLDRLGLEGGETVLDVGCGHGLLLIGAAKRLPRGRALGLDLWSQVDQGDNHRERTLANAAAEGVAERVEVHDGDMRKMPFPDASVDAVVSCLAIHNVHGRDERRRALQEIARVVRPGGQVAILDLAHIGQYASDLKDAGFAEVHTSGPSLRIYPPVRRLLARK